MELKNRSRWLASIPLLIGLGLAGAVLLPLHVGRASTAQSENLTDHQLREPVHEADHPADKRPHSDSYPTHYILFEMGPDGSIQPLSYRQVQLDTELTSQSGSELARMWQQPRRDVQQFELGLKDRAGRTLYQNAVQVPLWLRGEFHTGTPDSTRPSPIDGHLIEIDRPIFVVRLPVIENTILLMRNLQTGATASFDLEELAKASEISLKAGSRVRSSSSTAPSENRVDMLILGDGYTSSQEETFFDDAASIASEFLSLSPYSEYRNYIITHTLFVPSLESGADHPPYVSGCHTITCCDDPEMQDDPLADTFVDTAFDARFCANNIHRLLVVNPSAVYAAAAAVPEWDAIMVIVNDPTYGGSGGSFAVVSLHGSAALIAQHEYGHSFADLADEYESPYPGYPECSDISGPLCESNVTDVTTRDSVKWSPWISVTTPIPTEPEPQFADLVGLFEGARYQSSGMYRSGQSCIMRVLGAPFCQVPSQAYVLKLYDGGWGVPAGGISLIEPDSLSPISATLTVNFSSSQIFQAEILQPVGGPPVNIQWIIDGVPDALSHTSTYTYTPSLDAVGNTVEIQLQVTDPTPLVHTMMAGDSLQSSSSWNVTITDDRQRHYLPVVMKQNSP